MTEPHSAAAAVQVGASSITAVTLALVGVPHLALVWGFIGAVVMLVLTGPESRAGAMLSVLASGLVGAAGGSALAEYVAGAPQVSGGALVLGSLVIGAGAKPLLSQAIAVLSTWLGRAGGPK